MIAISKEEYKDLIQSRIKLEALESGGVDNWNGYSDSIQSYIDFVFENIYGLSLEDAIEEEIATEDYDLTDLVNDFIKYDNSKEIEIKYNTSIIRE